MRNAVRSVFLLLLGLLSAVFLGAAMAFVSAVSLAATALIVPGTGTPDANIVPNYMENARDYYLQGTFCTTEGGCDTPGQNLIGINYPASFWPLPFPGWCRSGPDGCDKWNVSVAKGVAGLDYELFENIWAQNPDEDIVIFGYSQGGQVVSNEMRVLADKLTPEQKQQLQIVMIGSIANPDGGLWPRLSPLSLLGQLLLDAKFGPPMITDSGIPTTVIGFEYDPVVYSPKYWGNPLALLNMLAAFETVHGQYLAGPDRPGSGSLPYGYTEEELEEALNDPANIRYGGNDPTSINKYIMIPAKSLPLADLILSTADSIGIKPIVKPFVDLLAPMAKVIIDLGYDWSGDPNVPQSLSILPFNPSQNWLAVAGKFVAAAFEGIQAFLHDLGLGPAPAAPTVNQQHANTLLLDSEAKTTKLTDKETLNTEKLAGASNLRLVRNSEGAGLDRAQAGQQVKQQDTGVDANGAVVKQDPTVTEEKRVTEETEPQTTPQKNEAVNNDPENKDLDANAGDTEGNVTKSDTKDVHDRKALSRKLFTPRADIKTDDTRHGIHRRDLGTHGVNGSGDTEQADTDKPADVSKPAA
ncbi:PE-PPE domain-containing protein [Mycobacterium sp. 1274761.0]|uniref:PE-PPE domain-containing protein n=1 Tax=Mycobacterium sp. 1274761.0 TaxID=1834077 RepID=UPI0007FCBEAE|nr:PE-PPE domain-containing protein [Mycobacterium sp. 1274761.0]OBK72891.1 hypothetical protein A5651_14925 [Mycobacterium sp. 1274761.0]